MCNKYYAIVIAIEFVVTKYLMTYHLRYDLGLFAIWNLFETKDFDCPFYCSTGYGDPGQWIQNQ